MEHLKLSYTIEYLLSTITFMAYSHNKTCPVPITSVSLNRKPQSGWKCTPSNSYSGEDGSREGLNILPVLKEMDWL